MKRRKHIGSHESWLYDVIGNLRLKPLHENLQEHSHRLNVVRSRWIDDSCHINKDRRGVWQTVVFDHQFNDSSPIVNADNTFGVYSHKSEMIVQAISNCHLWVRFTLCTETFGDRQPVPRGSVRGRPARIEAGTIHAVQ